MQIFILVTYDTVISSALQVAENFLIFTSCRKLPHFYTSALNFANKMLSKCANLVENCVFITIWKRGKFVTRYSTTEKENIFVLVSLELTIL